MACLYNVAGTPMTELDRKPEQRWRPTTRGAFLRSLAVVLFATFMGGGIPLTCAVDNFWGWGRRYRRQRNRRWAGNTPASEVSPWQFWLPFFLGAPFGAVVGLIVAWRKNFFRGRKFQWEDDDRHVIVD
jgi:hypothetical protein